MPASTKDPDILREEVKGTFSFRKEEGSPWIDVLYKLGDSDLDEDDSDDDWEEDRSTHSPKVGFSLDFGQVLLRLNPHLDRLEFQPLTRTDRTEFSNRYERVNLIALEGFKFSPVDDPDEVISMLAHFPKGLTQNPEYGLGVRKDYRQIVHAIEEVHGIKSLLISKRQQTGIKENTFVLSYRDFDDLRRAIDTCHRSALELAAKDKSNLVHNALLTKLDPAKYPERTRIPNQKTIFNVLDKGAKEPISDKNQLAAVKLVTRNRQSLAENHPEALMQLRRDIELVTLDQVIEKIDLLISGNTSEARWQGLFLDHPFILSLAFSLPIVLFQEQASVGGGSFSRKGEKIADFLFKNGLTDNLTIIEIKAASTPLLGPEYRDGVYPPSQALAGAITQALDQKHKLEEEFLIRKNRIKNGTAERFAVRCIVIAGKTPADRDKLKSFEIFRATLHDVLVVTFDELLAKIKNLRDFLAEDPSHKDASAASSRQ
jgi:hypothetical protein